MSFTPAQIGNARQLGALQSKESRGNREIVVLLITIMSPKT